MAFLVICSIRTRALRAEFLPSDVRRGISRSTLLMRKGVNKVSGMNRNKSNLESKICVQCGLPMEWRKSWAKNWDSVKFCSDKCRKLAKRDTRRDGDASPLWNSEQLRSLSEQGREESLGIVAMMIGTAVAATSTGAAPAFAAVTNGAVIEAEETGTPGFFRRLDETPDEGFYADPRFVEHIDANAVRKLTSFHEAQLARVADKLYGDSTRPLDILDVCSSWVSHLPVSYASKRSNVTGIGMNADELAGNPVLTDAHVQNLNSNPKLPVADSQFDVALIQLSIDYLTQPVAVLKDIGRCLRPKGELFVSFSNRVFLTKAVAGWTGKSDEDHIDIVKELVALSGTFEDLPVEVMTVVPARGPSGRGDDPLFVVTATRR